MLIAFMILTLLERILIESLKSKEDRIIVSGKRKTFIPTRVSILEIIDYSN
ncbi:hypothetical protein [Paramaledivibacter caminithermalis]|uniref:hypothetical protein n=1 Tax=Paramaledivibacter caminithermalis TaxID=191027 RepID=UPI0013F4FB28|nr:hypothetical protein [Paramaledivibacter caminithermalis]